MLGSEDAFSYAIARTENLVQTVGSKPTIGGRKKTKDVPLVRFRSSSGPKTIIDVVPMKANEGERNSPVGATRSFGRKRCWTAKHGTQRPREPRIR